MIYNRDQDQERFVSGLSLNKNLIQKEVVISLVNQFLVGHKGGQINVNSGPLETVFNSATGVELERSSHGVVSRWVANGFYVYYSNLSSANQRPYKDGSGIYFNATAATRFGLDIMMSYWRAYEFLSIEGGKIYPSVSVFDSGVQQEEMELLIFRFLYNRTIARGLQLGVRMEPHYDLSFRSFQYSYGFYLQFNDRFFITRKR